MKKLKILAYLPHHIKDYGIGYAAHSISLAMNNTNVISDIFSIHSDLAQKSKHVKQAFRGKLSYRFVTKFLKDRNVIALTEQRFKKRMKEYDVAYLWPGCSIKTVHYLKNTGKIIVFENINCHQRYAKKILDNEATRLGLSDFHHITEDSILDEEQKLMLADFVFSPSPEVTKSLRQANIDEKKIIQSSYGLDADEIILKNHRLSNAKVNALFVGSVIPRKGVQLLLDYWEASAVDAKLIIIGKIDEALKKIVEQYRPNPNIEFISFTNDLESYYSKADIFIMPSLEEGSPLVTYLALGAGLPAILSPMAGEGVYKNDVNGFIIDPYDKSSWIDKIRQLVRDASLRKKMSLSLRNNAEFFLWHNVAQRRVSELCRRLESE